MPHPAVTPHADDIIPNVALPCSAVPHVNETIPEVVLDIRHPDKIVPLPVEMNQNEVLVVAPIA